MGCRVRTELCWGEGRRGIPEAFEQKDKIMAEQGGGRLGDRVEGGVEVGEALTVAKCFCFAGSDVLQWITQRLWVSSLGESSSFPPRPRAAVCASPWGHLWRVEAKRGSARVSEKLTF